MPRFAIILALVFTAALAGGCSDENSSAPATNEAHPADWIVIHNAEALDDPDSCAACHGADLRGGTVGVSCFACHTAGSPLALFGCTSCHNVPPDGGAPAGNFRPNREGGHLAHDVLPKVTGVCDTCHTGAGSGAFGHFDGTEPADVAIAGVFGAKTGTRPQDYDPADGTCANVSCHGGQTTPSWQTGVLNVNFQCESCHELGTASQTPQFNSFFSGKHEFHVVFQQIDCTFCHAVDKLAAGHFIGLDTPQFEQDPAGTLLDILNYNTAVVPPTCTTQIVGCHPGAVRSWAP